MSNQKKRLLIIDKDSHILSYLKAVFSSQEYNVFVSASGIDAARIAKTSHPDIILLDPDLSDIYIEDLMPLLKKYKQIPIIIISKSNDEKDMLRAFSFGADDYLTKPFSISELKVRIETALRHTSLSGYHKTFKNGELTVNFDAREVRCENEIINFTATEYALFELLAKSAGKVLTYGQLIKKLWGKNSSADSRRLHVNMTNIRKKLAVNSGITNYIVTQNGIGYIMPLIK